MDSNLASLKHSMLKLYKSYFNCNNLMFFPNLFCPQVHIPPLHHQDFTRTSGASFKRI